MSVHPPISAHKHHLKGEHFRAWLDQQEPERREQSEVRARLADAERRLNELERRVSALNGPPMQGATQ